MTTRIRLHWTVNDNAVLADATVRSWQKTLTEFPGPTTRGVLNALAMATGSAELHRQWIVDGRLQAALGLPVLDGAGTSSIVPADWVETTDDDDHPVLAPVDSLAADCAFSSPPGYGILTYDGFCPVTVETATTLRLVRSRERGAVEGYGPFAVQYLTAGQRWCSDLLWTGPDDEAGTVVETLTSTAAKQPLTVGSNRDSGFGGSVTVTAEIIDDLTALLPPSLVDGVPAGTEFCLVATSPALVRGDHGDHDPAAFSTRVAELVSTVVGSPVTITGGALASSTVSGSPAGFGGHRPTVPAAGASSCVYLSADVDVAADALATVLTCRVGDRTVDGFGVLGVWPCKPVPLVTPQTPSTRHPIPTPEQWRHDPQSTTLWRELLLDRVLPQWWQDWLTDTAAAWAETATDLPRPDTLRTLADIAGPGELNNLANRLQNNPRDARCRIGTGDTRVTLHQWCRTMARPDETTPAAPTHGDDTWNRRWPAHLDQLLGDDDTTRAVTALRTDKEAQWSIDVARAVGKLLHTRARISKETAP
ncbi:hypothetical protein [Dietzia sp. SYD-A1]|uniref:hypothetical protein n=1 Tax=Dietzia sp. SYD-A1 TaxID=2780141 RepID=UPI00189126D3|nr:hypothetical protein [Dietzia sp. SYD-A1]